jgi:thioredoxin-like negative regulator of GroEL
MTSSVTRRSLFALAASGAALMLAAPAFAQRAPAAFSQAAFDRAINAKETVVAHIHADWCSTCRTQANVLRTLAADPAFAKTNFLTVNFDTDRAFMQANNVTSRSVILVFRDGREVARLNGTTNAAEIRQRLTAAAGV